MYADKQPIGGRSFGEAAGYTVGVESDKRQPEVMAEMQRAEKSMDCLGDSLNEFLNRLDGVVLRPAPPSTLGSAQATAIQAAPPQTSVGNGFHGLHRRMTELAERVQEAMRRLEV